MRINQKTNFMSLPQKHFLRFTANGGRHPILYGASILALWALDPPPSTQIQILNPLVTASCLQLLSLNTGELN